MIKNWDDMSEEEKAAAVRRWKATGKVTEKDLSTRKDMTRAAKGSRGGMKGRMG